MRQTITVLSVTVFATLLIPAPGVRAEYLALTRPIRGSQHPLAIVNDLVIGAFSAPAAASPSLVTNRPDGKRTLPTKTQTHGNVNSKSALKADLPAPPVHATVSELRTREGGAGLINVDAPAPQVPIVHTQFGPTLGNGGGPVWETGTRTGVPSKSSFGTIASLDSHAGTHAPSSPSVLLKDSVPGWFDLKPARPGILNGDQPGNPYALINSITIPCPPIPCLPIPCLNNPCRSNPCSPQCSANTPEPSTLTLLGVGFLGIAGVKRYRRAKED